MAASYVCVKITNLAELDLELVQFDFDLTFALVLMHTDGTIYHRYGGRDSHDAQSHIGMPSLLRLLRETLVDHAAYDREPAVPKAKPPRRPFDLPPLRKKLAAGQRIDCVHCHTVHDAQHAQAVETKAWRKEDLWLYPEPLRIGLTLDAGDQALVRHVHKESPAAVAGLQAGDRLLALGAQARVRTFTDVQWALHQAAPGPTTLPLRYERAGQATPAELELPAGWKHCSPEEYAWRPYKWNLAPMAGFGGDLLDARQRSDHGIAGQFAFTVTYIVDWGERAPTGRAVRRAGLRKGDIVVSFAGKSDFVSMDHFHAWIALQCEVGQEVEIETLREGVRQTKRLRFEG